MTITKERIETLYTIEVMHAGVLHKLQCTYTQTPLYNFWGKIYFTGKGKYSLTKAEKRSIRAQVFEKLVEI